MADDYNTVNTTAITRSVFAQENTTSASLDDNGGKSQVPKFVQDIVDNQAVSDPFFYVLIILYTLMIIGSVIGNVLVIIAVLKSPNMRKVNNILIVNLAISDLLLCTIFSPLTLIEVLHKRWIGPKAQWLCHLSTMGPVCITFVSTLTITGIAIDRYKVIVYSANNRTPQKASTAFMTVLAIWTLSILLSFPLFFGTNLEVIQMPESVVRMIHDDSIAYCAEKWGEYEKGRLVYSCFILVMQFILPIVLISWAHHAIKQKLQKLPSWSISSKNNSNSIRRLSCKPEESNLGKYAPQALEESQNGISRLSKLRESVMKGKSTQRRQSNALEINGEGNGNNEGAAQHPDLVLQMQENRLREKIKKQSRTHALLVSIVVVFALSWLPLNVLNIILDVSNIFSSDEAGKICFSFCHLIGMSSAFSNPILYGWFNEAFKEEFQNIARLLMCWKSSESHSPEAERRAKANGQQEENIPMIRRGPLTQSKKLCANHMRHQIPMDHHQKNDHQVVRIIENKIELPQV